MLPDFSGNSSTKNNILFVDEVTLSKDPVSQEKLSKLIHESINVAVVCTEATKVNYKGIFNTLTKPLQTKHVYEYIQSAVEQKYTLFDQQTTPETINANVLLAEDNEVNQMVAKGMLDNMGCNVFIAENGLIALDALKKHKFDIVLMDINMPELNGSDATIQFRTLEKEGEHMPIIALTANVMQEDVDSYYKAGMDDHLSKPFTTDNLREKLEQWLVIDKIEHVVKQDENEENEHIDVSIIDNLKTMMGDGYSDLVNTFIQRSIELKEAIVSNPDDYDKMIQDIHSLKGSCGTMGAKKIFLTCQEFENQLRSGEYVNRDKEIEKISNELDAVHAYFK